MTQGWDLGGPGWVKNFRVGSDFIWPFLWHYMGVISNPKMAFIFPISFILALIFPVLIKLETDPRKRESRIDIFSI